METNQHIAHARMQRLRARIKSRIFNIWFLKYELPLLLGEIILVCVAVYGIGRFVFVERVVSNAFLITLGSPWKLFLFFFDAFLATSLWTKAAVILLLAAGLLILRDVNKSMVTYFLMHRKGLPRHE